MDFEWLRPFQALPNIDWHDPNLQIIDIDGDGLADLLISEDDAFVWFRSKADLRTGGGGGRAPSAVTLVANRDMMQSYREILRKLSIEAD